MTESGLMHLDEIQGRNEQRNELYGAVLRKSSAVSDAVARQKWRQSFWLCQKAGRHDA